MSASTGIPKRVEEVLSTHRRGFLKSAGLLVVSFGAGTVALNRVADAQSSATPPRITAYLLSNTNTWSAPVVVKN